MAGVFGSSAVPSQEGLKVASSGSLFGSPTTSTAVPAEGGLKVADSTAFLQTDHKMVDIPESTITYYTGSDVTLLVQDKKNSYRLLVSSHILSIASPVFKTIFAPNRFKEGACLQAGNALVIDLRKEDDCPSMILLCAILHFNVKRIPDELLPEKLGDLCVLLDKYDCALPIKQTVKIWIQRPAIKNVLGNKQNIAPGDDTLMLWLAISYTLGDDSNFSYFSNRVLSEFSLAKIDKLGGRLSPAVHDAIRKRVEQNIQMLLQQARNQLHVYMYPIGKRCTVEQTDFPTAHDCDSFALGSIYLGFSSLRKPPVCLSSGDQYRWNESVKGLIDELNRAANGFHAADRVALKKKHRTYYSHGNGCFCSSCTSYTYAHSTCNPSSKFKKDVATLQKGFQGFSLREFRPKAQLFRMSS